MDLVNCPSCGTEVSTQATSCSKCGHPFKKTVQGMSGGQLILLIVGAIIIAAIILGLGL